MSKWFLYALAVVDFVVGEERKYYKFPPFNGISESLGGSLPQNL